MFSTQKGTQKQASLPAPENGKPAASPVALLTVIGERARMEGKFDIADSIHVECEIGGELNVGSKLVIGEKGVVHAKVQTVDAIIMGHYEGTMVATGNVEITATGRVSGNITTDSLVISNAGGVDHRAEIARLARNGAHAVEEEQAPDHAQRQRPHRLHR